MVRFKYLVAASIFLYLGQRLLENGFLPAEGRFTIVDIRLVTALGTSLIFVPPSRRPPQVVCRIRLLQRLDLFFLVDAFLRLLFQEPVGVRLLQIIMVHSFDVDEEPLDETRHFKVVRIGLLHLWPPAIEDGIDALSGRDLKIHGGAQQLHTFPGDRDFYFIFATTCRCSALAFGYLFIY